MCTRLKHAAVALKGRLPVSLGQAVHSPANRDHSPANKARSLSASKAHSPANKARSPSASKDLF